MPLNQSTQPENPTLFKFPFSVLSTKAIQSEYSRRLTIAKNFCLKAPLAHLHIVPSFYPRGLTKLQQQVQYLHSNTRSNQK